MNNLLRIKELQMAEQIISDIKNQPVRFRVKPGWNRSHDTGFYFGYIVIKDIRQGIVLFDDEEDPELYTAQGLEIQQNTWVEIV